MTFKNLIVWKKSVELAKQIYLLTQHFPKSETYGLAAQMQRCAISIPSNIAEGHSRNNRKEYIQFIGIAYGHQQNWKLRLSLQNQYTQI